MEEKISIKNKFYDIPAIVSNPNSGDNFPAIILCHGTGSFKDEVGNLFIKLSESLKERGIASIRFDFAGCGESLAKQQDLTFYGEVSDTEKIYSYLLDCHKIDSKRIGILGSSQGARVMAEFIGKYPEKIKAAVSWSELAIMEQEFLKAGLKNFMKKQLEMDMPKYQCFGAMI